MTLRQWYEGMAMQGLLASGLSVGASFESTAKIAAGLASAMLAEDAAFEETNK